MPIAARLVLCDDSHHRLLLLPLVRPLFVRTGFESALRTSYSSHRIEATGFAGKKEFRWPPVPLLPALPLLNLLLACAEAEDGAPRVTHERFYGRHLPGLPARSAPGPGRSLRIGNSESLASLRLIADRARRHFHHRWLSGRAP
jgi:hypothetical protein